MKRLIQTMSVLFFLVAPLSLSAASWEQAENLYRDSNFAAALAEYEALRKDYPNDPYLYYNIGNCYFKIGGKGLAAANYYRAFRLAPRDKDIRHNLSLALQSGGEKLVPAGVPEGMHQAFFWLRIDELLGVLAILWVITSVLTALWLLKRRGGRLTLCMLCLLIFTAVWYGWRKQQLSQPLAVVASPVAELRSGPGEGFPASANIAQGHLLLLQDTKDNWQEVVVKSRGLKGWIQSDALEKI